MLHLRQFALVRVRMPPVKLLRDRQPQNCIAEKFERLVIVARRSRSRPASRSVATELCVRATQQGVIRKTMSDPFFEVRNAHRGLVIV